MKCHFCGQPAAGACAWPVTALDLVTVGDLKVGDVIRRGLGSKITETILSIRSIMPGKYYMREMAIEKRLSVRF